MRLTGIDLKARSRLRGSLLGYFAASIVLLVAMVVSWSWVERRSSNDIDTLQRTSRTNTDELSRLRSTGMSLRDALDEIDRRFSDGFRAVGPAGFEPAAYGLKVRSSTS